MKRYIWPTQLIRKFSNERYNLINGTIGYVEHLNILYDHPMKGSCFVDLRGEIGDVFSNLCINLNYNEYIGNNLKGKIPKPVPFDFGYAISCHKAQGSEFDKVIVFDESKCFSGERNKWLYTAITRAKETVTVATVA